MLPGLTKQASAPSHAERVPVVLISGAPRVQERAHATRGRCHLAEVMLPCGQTSDTLARFAAGFKAARERPPVEET